MDGVGSKDGKRFLIECKSTSDETGFLDRDGNLDHDHDYYYQVVGYMEIHSLLECWFVVMTKTELKTEIKKLEISRDSYFFLREMVPKLERFYLYHYLPRVMQKRAMRAEAKGKKSMRNKGDGSDSDSDVA